MSNQLHAYVVEGRFVAFGSKEEINKMAIRELSQIIAYAKQLALTQKSFPVIKMK